MNDFPYPLDAFLECVKAHRIKCQELAIVSELSDQEAWQDELAMEISIQERDLLRVFNRALQFTGKLEDFNMIL